MIRAMLWKEFREQGLIALTLLVLGTGILVAAAVLGDPPATASGPTDIVRALGAGRLAALMLAVTAGMVCGGALFAAERESGTIGFLESLPASRWQVWRAKLIAGTVLAVVQVGVVLAVAGLLGIAPRDFATRVCVYAALAFVWGAYGSTVSRTTLGSVGVAIPCAILAAFAFLIPVVLFFPSPGTNLPRPEGEFLFLVLMLGVPVAMSALAFTRQDRDRASEDVRPAAWVAARVATPVKPVADTRLPAPASVGPRFGLKALLWLAVKQTTGTALVLSAFAVVFGLMLLTPGLKPFLMWPSLALAAGVLAGATVFSDEQSSGSARFWGDWRLPAGRMWAVKVAVHAGLALWLVVLLLLPIAVRSQFTSGGPVIRGQAFLSGVFGSLLFDELERQGWKLVFLPTAYGFAAGHLCGMLFKKVVVAVGVAALLGGTTAALWIPSLLAGGVHHWQVWLPPIAALVVARCLVRPWASNRLATRGPIWTVAGGTAAVLFVQAVGLGYRVLEVPAKPDGEADTAFVARLPLLDENTVGREMRAAGERYGRLASLNAAKYDAPKPGTRQYRIDEKLDAVTVTGWQYDADVAKFLNEMYGDPGDEPENMPWHVQAHKAASQTPGMYEDPRLVTGAQTQAALENARRMAAAVVARGLQRQAEGDPAEFVRSLHVALGTARNVRNNSIVAAVNVANAIDRSTLLVPVEKWLANLNGRPDLLRAALAVVRVDDTRAPFDPTPHLLAERYMLRELMKAPAQWVPDVVAPGGKARGDNNVEADLVGFAWTVPWERERTRRLIGLGFEASVEPHYYRLLRGRPGRGLLVGRFLNAADIVEYDRLLRTLRRVAAVRIAVRLHEAEKGTVPASPAELVSAGYLPDETPDPYDGAPLRYRVSAGERLGGGPPPDGRAIEPRPWHQVQPGQVVLWSVGPNKTDEGGKQSPYQPYGPVRIDDLVFVVPRREIPHPRRRSEGAVRVSARPVLSRWRLAMRRMMGFAAVAAVLGTVPDAALAQEKLAPATRREMARAVNNMKQIGLAFHAFHDTTGSFPTDIKDKDGKALLSWRVAILPYIEQDQLYKQFKLNEPWDSANNKPLIAKMPEIYAPIRVKGKEGETFYQTVTGPNTLFDGKTRRTFVNVTDGTSNTGMVFQAAEAVTWSKPADMVLDAKKPLKLGGMFDGESHVTMGDGSVKTLKKDPDADELKKLINPADGNVIDFKKLEK